MHRDYPLLSSFLIGIEPDGLNEQIAGWLEAAAAHSPEPIEVLDEHELLWVVRRFEGCPVPAAMPVAAATTRLAGDVAEIVLIGGRGFDWIAPLSDMVASWAKMEGKKAVRAFGRAGWQRVLPRHGWSIMGQDNGIVAYEREV